MTASYAECWTQFTAGVKYLELQHRIGGVTVDNLLGQSDTLIQALEAQDGTAGQILAGLRQARRGAADCLASASAVLTPLMFNFAPVIDADPREGVQAFFTRWYDYHHANSKSVNARNFTRGAFSSGSPYVGTGTINRLTTDKNGYPIENSYADTITAAVVSDQSSGVNAGQEVWEFRGRDAGEDALDLEQSGRGSGRVKRISSKSADDSLLLNPSFSQYAGTVSSPTAITNWTFGTDVTVHNIDTTNYYRSAVIEGTAPASLELTATETITQALSVRKTTLNPDIPYYLQLAWNRQVGSGSGDLELHLGAQSSTVTAAAQTGWQVLRVAIGTKNWYQNFNENGLDIKIVWTRTGGTVLIDDVVFVPFDDFDGCWICPVGGATPFLLRDTGTFTDTEAGAIIARWIWRAFGRFLPSNNAGAETEADPSISYT